jgi:hypothetical protein
VIHEIVPRDLAFHQFLLRAVRHDRPEIRVIREPGDVLPAAGGEVVDHRHLRPAAQQLFRQVRPDKTGAAGDQNFFRTRHFFLSHHSPQNTPAIARLLLTYCWRIADPGMPPG